VSGKKQCRRTQLLPDIDAAPEAKACKAKSAKSLVDKFTRVAHGTCSAPRKSAVFDTNICIRTIFARRRLGRIIVWARHLTVSSAHGLI
jgi:hypothetical protein